MYEGGVFYETEDFASFGRTGFIDGTGNYFADDYKGKESDAK